MGVGGKPGSETRPTLTAANTLGCETGVKTVIKPLITALICDDGHDDILHQRYI